MSNETNILITRTILEVENKNLKPYIDSYWVFRTNKHNNFYPAISIPPIAYPTLQLVLGNYKGIYQLENTNIKSLITGLYNRHVTLAPRANMGLIIINFKAYGYYNLFGQTPPNDKLNVTEACKVFGEEKIDKLINDISESSDRNELINKIENFLLENQNNKVIKQIYFDSLVDDIIAKNGLINLNELINEKFSLRTFQRYFSKTIGTSPKKFSRILRHKYIIKLMYNNPNISWNDLSFHGYYFDQSHFTKDFYDFAKYNPKNFNWFKSSIISEIFK